jgi:hypothetical protein
MDTPGLEASGEVLEEWECVYVLHKDAEKYREAGWTLTQLLGNHGRYSVLAVKRVKPRCKLTRTKSRALK